jgi:uncharacterized protein YdeI (YjbR/CyaY-like superfamily)
VEILKAANAQEMMKGKRRKIMMDDKKKSGAELPIGLMMSLAMNPDAMKNFSQLDDEKQSSVIRYIESANTGDEARTRIGNAVDELSKGNIQFFG